MSAGDNEAQSQTIPLWPDAALDDPPAFPPFGRDRAGHIPYPGLAPLRRGFSFTGLSMAPADENHKSEHCRR